MRMLKVLKGSSKIHPMPSDTTILFCCRSILTHLTVHFEDEVAAWMANDAVRVDENMRDLNNEVVLSDEDGKSSLKRTQAQPCHLAALMAFVTEIGGPTTLALEVPNAHVKAAETFVFLLQSWASSNLSVSARIVDMESGSGLSDRDGNAFLASCVDVVLFAMAHALQQIQIHQSSDRSQGEQKGGSEGNNSSIQYLNGNDNSIVNCLQALEVRFCLLSNLCRCEGGRELVCVLSKPCLASFPRFLTQLAGVEQASSAVSAALGLYHSIAPLVHQTFRGGMQSSGLVGVVIPGASKPLSERWTREYCKSWHPLVVPMFEATLLVACEANELSVAEEALTASLYLARHGSCSTLASDAVLSSIATLIARFLPTELPTVIPQPDNGWWNSKLRSLACDKCLRLLQCSMRADEWNRSVNVDSDEQSAVNICGRDLVSHSMRILMGSARTIEWMPAILRAGEVLETLVLELECAAEFQALKQNGKSKIVACTGSNLEASHVVLENVLEINNITQPVKANLARRMQLRLVDDPVLPQSKNL